MSAAKIVREIKPNDVIYTPKTYSDGTHGINIRYEVSSISNTYIDGRPIFRYHQYFTDGSRSPGTRETEPSFVSGSCLLDRMRPDFLIF